MRNVLLLCFLLPATVLAFATIHNHNSKSTLNLSTSSSESMHNDYKAVIFDLDGTLCDSWKLGYEATLTILHRYNIPPISESTYHEGTRYSTPERLARHAGLVPDQDDNFWTVGQQMADDFDNLYVGLVSRDTAGFYPEIESLLLQIPRHVSLGALTNAAVRYAQAVLQVNCPVVAGSGHGRASSYDDDNDSGIYHRFKSIRGADNVPEPKPSPAGLLQVCKDLGIDPKDCVYVGDSPTDGLAAHAAGMKAIGVLWGSHGKENLQRAPFSHLCETVEELQALLPQ